jgi:hypothetical protein
MIKEKKRGRRGKELKGLERPLFPACPFNSFFFSFSGFISASVE